MPPDHLAVLQRETAVLADLLAAGELSTPVPSCPGWSLADLGRHTGEVHLWARAALGSTTAPDEPSGPADDAAVPGFYAGSAQSLLATLRATPPEMPCWTFDHTNPTARFWLRRQAHETTMHRWDAERALGHDAVIDPAVALDGIDEVLGMFLPRQIRLDRIPVTADVVHLIPEETGAVLPVGTGEPTGDPLGTVRGPASALLLLLWRRIGVDDPGLSVTGDPSACLDRPLTP